MTTVLPISTKFCSRQFGGGNTGLCYGAVRGKNSEEMNRAE